MRGTQAAEFMGIPSTGRQFEVLVLDMVRVSDGKIAEHWALLDENALQQQLRGT
jgi:predicted ester cyclase